MLIQPAKIQKQVPKLLYFPFCARWVVHNCHAKGFCFRFTQVFVLYRFHVIVFPSQTGSTALYMPTGIIPIKLNLCMFYKRIKNKLSRHFCQFSIIFVFRISIIQKYRYLHVYIYFYQHQFGLLFVFQGPTAPC